MPRRPPRSPRRVAGLSLLEMLLVVALIAIIGAVTATAMNGGIDGMRLRNAGKELASQLRYTRTQAIATGERQRFLIDPQARTWQAANGRHGTVPPSLEVRFRGAREVATAAGQGAIAFYPMAPPAAAASTCRCATRSGTSTWAGSPATYARAHGGRAHETPARLLAA